MSREKRHRKPQKKTKQLTPISDKKGIWGWLSCIKDFQNPNTRGFASTINVSKRSIKDVVLGFWCFLKFSELSCH